MLQDGSLVVADEALRQTVKYALDQLGYAPDDAPIKKRRTSFDEQSLSNEYNGPFKIVKLTNSETGNVSGFAVVDGESYKPSEGTCDPMKINFKAKNHSVSIFKYNSLPSVTVYVYAYLLINAESVSAQEVGILVSETAISTLGNLALQFIGSVKYSNDRMTITQSFNGAYVSFAYNNAMASQFYTMLCYNKPSDTTSGTPYVMRTSKVHVNAGNISPIELSVSGGYHDVSSPIYVKVIAVYNGDTFSHYEASYVSTNPESDTVFGYLLYNTAGWCYQGGSIAITGRWV